MTSKFNKADDLRPCVFLDRDGCLIEEVDYLTQPEQVRVIHGSAAAVRRLNEAGLLAIMVSNQSGVARGFLTEEMLQRIHARLKAKLARRHARLDGVYYCPYHQQAKVKQYRQDSPLRKPQPGMVELAAREYPIDVSRSYVVGDKNSDIDLGKNCGMKTVLVLTGYGKAHGEKRRAMGAEPPDFVAANLARAVDWILQDLKRSR